MAEEGDSRLLLTCFWLLSDKCLHKIMGAAWVSRYYTAATSTFASSAFFFLNWSLPLRTSEDERGNRDREVLGQSLGVAGRMHWAVVGGAASVGEGRPGPVSTWRGRDVASLSTNSEYGPSANGARKPDRKEKIHTRTNTTPLRYSLSVRGPKKGENMQLFCINKKLMLSSDFSLT